MVTSPRIEQQQLSINKFSLNFTRYQKIVAGTLLYTIPGARYKKKTRTRVGRWLYERYYSKKLILKYQSKYLCCGLQNKIIKNPVSRRTRFHAVEACKNHVSLDNSVKSVVFHHSGCCGETGMVKRILFMLSSVQQKPWFYKSLENIFIDFSWKKLVKHWETHQNFSPTFWGKMHYI